MSLADLLPQTSGMVLNASTILLLIERLDAEQRAVLFEQLGVKNEEGLINWFSTSRPHQDTYEQQLMRFQEYRTHKELKLWLPPVLLVVGTIGNLLSFLILMQPAMRKSSTYIYLAVLSITDTLVLYVGLLPMWVTEITGYDIRTVNWVCKVINVVGYTVSDYSVWLIIAVTVERFIAVCFPLHAPTMCNRRRALSVILFLLGLLFIINCHFMWTAAAIRFPHHEELITQCTGAADFKLLVVDVWPWVDAFIYSFLPFAVITVLNILIIHQVLQARHQRKHLQSSSVYKEQRSRQQPHEAGYKLTVMLLTISFTFLLTTLPVNISLIATAFWDSYNDDLAVVAKFMLVRTITSLLMYTNHSINFFLYCATGLRFRQQLFSLTSCLKRSDSRMVRPNRSSHNSSGRMGASSPEMALIVMNPTSKLEEQEHSPGKPRHSKKHMCKRYT